jgi:hypothetical protein
VSGLETVFGPETKLIEVHSLSNTSIMQTSYFWTFLPPPLALQPAVGFGLSNNILVFPLFNFRNNKFLLCGVVSPTPNPQHGGPGYPFLFGLSPLLDLTGMGGLTSSIHYRQHSSWDHVTTQAPPPRQSRDTFGGTSGL